MDFIQEYAKATSKFCMYIHFDNKLPCREIRKAAPYLSLDQVVMDGLYILTFDTENEMDEYFDMTVGDDGPTKDNSYTGMARVYAVTISNKGELLTENT